MKTPTTTSHKPVIISENYDKVDGRFAQSSDAKSLSLGLTQWNDQGKFALSAKVWGNTGEQRTRQLEELPLHRFLDLSIMICRSIAHFRDAYRYEHFYDPQKPVIDRIGLQGAAMTVAVNTDNERINEDMKLFSQALSADDELIGERLRALSRMLKEMGY
ncbi:DUF6530 family protein [Brevibacillus sp. NRS-1366]|uniref:DUF6530 family protein n=1 Tax=Brevibacillus sp. NRS-1366 TaxID=3233899 RepID=UPI003D198339